MPSRITRSTGVGDGVGGGISMFQHHEVSRRKVRALEATWVGVWPPKSQFRNAVSWALRVMSGRDCVVDAPHFLHRQRVRPAVVVPFLTSLDPHTPQVGEFRVTDTEHAFRACSAAYRSRSGPEYWGFCTHILAINPRRADSLRKSWRAGWIRSQSAPYPRPTSAVPPRDRGGTSHAFHRVRADGTRGSRD